MSPRLRIAIAASALVVAAIAAAVVALYPHRTETTLPASHTLKAVRHQNAFGARCFLEDDFTGHVERIPGPCHPWPQRPDAGPDSVLAMLGGTGGSTVSFCLYDRTRLRNLACFTGWFPAWMRVSPTSVAIVDREATYAEVTWIDRESGRRHVERVSQYVGDGQVKREVAWFRQYLRVGDLALEPATPLDQP